MPQRTDPATRANRSGAHAAEARRSLAAYDIAGGPQSNQIYSDDEEEFIRAMDRFKADTKNPFPSWSEALAVLKSLGYHRRYLISSAEATSLVDDPVIWERIERGEVVDVPAGRLRRADSGSTK